MITYKSMGTKKVFRIKKNDDFSRIFSKHCSFANRFLIIYVDRQPKLVSGKLNHWRLGLSVSKRIGKAHERVWVKRRIRESLNNLSLYIPHNLDIVIIARTNIGDKNQYFIQKQLIHVLKLAGIFDEKKI